MSWTTIAIIAAVVVLMVELWRRMSGSSRPEPTAPKGVDPSQRKLDRELPSSVAGVTHGKRQTFIRQDVSAGDALELREENDNPVDQNAIALYSRAGNQIGYLNARLAADTRRWARDGVVTVNVTEVTGGTRDKPTRGVNIVLRVWEPGE